MSNYAIYPTKHMRITQNFNGSVSHKPHTVGMPKDYPIDDGCTNSGRDWCYCPCDEMKIERIYGVGNGGTNTIWLESTSKVIFPNGKSDFLTMLITHPNDSDLKRLKVGQKFKRKEKICREGSDGATGNHFHFSFGLGKVTGNGWTLSSTKKWVLTTASKAAKPQDVLFIDKAFTTVINSGGLTFKALPAESAMVSHAPQTSFLPEKGYFTKGDTSKNIGKIAAFMRKTFPAYTNKAALGNTLGVNLIAAVKEFQKRTGLEADGNIGPLTLKKLKEYGFKE